MTTIGNAASSHNSAYAEYRNYRPEEAVSKLANNLGITEQEAASKLGLGAPGEQNSVFEGQTNSVDTFQSSSKMSKPESLTGDLEKDVKTIVDEFGIDSDTAESLLSYQFTGDPDTDAQSLSGILGLSLDETKDMLGQIYGEPQKKE